MLPEPTGPTSASPAISPPDLRREWGDPTAVFVLLLGLYAWSAPRTVAFEDDGGFIMAAEFLGIAHPPGYPLYVLIAKLGTLIPLGSVAYRVHLVSGVLGAATCGVIWWIVRSLTAQRRVAAIAAIAYGISPVMWSQSIIAEVYTLNTLLFFSIFALALVTLHRERAALLPWMAFLFGLSLCNHYPLALLAAVSLVPILWKSRGALVKQLPLALLALFVALLPYAWMVVRSLQKPEFSFYGPIRSLDELVYYVGRKGYALLENDPTADFADKLAFAKFLVVEAFFQYTPIGALIAGTGAIWQLRVARAGWGIGLVLGFLGGGFAVAVLVTMDFQFIQKMIFRVYPMVPYGIMAIWLGYGLALLGERLGESRAKTAIPALGFVLLSSIFLLGVGTNDRHDDTFARDYAQGVLESLERDAILFVDTDPDIFPMGYLHLVEGIRPDVSLYHYEGLILPTRLIHARDGSLSARERSARKLLAKTRRPVYFAIPRDLGYGYEDLGLYAKLLRDRPFSVEMDARVDPELLKLVSKLNETKEEDLGDPWTRMQLEVVLAKMTSVLARVLSESPDDPRSAAYRASLDEFSVRYLPAYARLTADIQAGTRAPAELLEAVVRLETLLDDRVSNANRVAFHAIHGRLLVDNGRDADAVPAFEAAWRIFPNESNLAFMELLRLHARLGDRDAYHALRGSLAPSRGSRELIRLDRKMGY